MPADHFTKRGWAPIARDGVELRATASIGIAPDPPPSVHSEDVPRNAEACLHVAKRRSGLHALIEPRMDGRQTQELEMNRARDEGEFRVYYQPIVDLHTGRISDLEALVRWQHPARGLLPPADFVPLAEETGFIAPLGRWVLTQACCQARLWQEARPGEIPLGICVNLSGHELMQPGLVAEVAAILDATGLHPNALELEVSERVAMEDGEATVATLTALRGLGVRLAIDDFGIGSSGLLNLKRYPVDTVKIDRAFVAGLGKSPDDAAIVRAVLAMARGLGLRATAEGIETAEHVAELRALGCEHGQGHYFSPPLPSEAVGGLLAGRWPWSPPGKAP